MSFKKIVAITLISLSTLTLSSCAYRADLAQGNFVEQENINKLRYGMTTDQVRYILGTPMLTDPFDNTKWYYVHYLRKEWEDPSIKNLICVFQGKMLVDIQGDFEKPADFLNQSSNIQKIEYTNDDLNNNY